MALHRDTAHRLTQLLRNVSAVTPLDPEIDRLREQFAEFERTAGQPAAVDLLAAAVATGDTETLPVLFAASLAEVAGTAQAAADVVSQVRHRVHRKIRDRMADTGNAVYAEVAKQYDQAAVAFIEANSAVDLEASAEVVLGMADKARKAWLAAPALAADLNRLATALHCAAVLAGIAADDANGEILVAVDTHGVDTGAVAAAWMTVERESKAARSAVNVSPFTGQATPTTSRTGRWSALLRAGATLRAYDPALQPV